MTWTPTEPAWAAPSRHEIADLHWLAYRTRRDSGGPWFAGVTLTLAWARGGRAAPITGRSAGLVTREIATYEGWAATAAATPNIAPPPLRSIAADLDVELLHPQPVDPELAEGAWRTIRWLLGEPGQRAPIPLPVRRADGSVPTAHELYDLAIAAAPERFVEAEQRADLSRRCQDTAHRYQQIAAVIADTRAALAGAGA